MESWPATILGIVAGLCSTASFVPQVLKAWREGDTGAISLKMYSVTVTAFVLWTAYGFLIGSLPVIVFNALSLCLAATILVLKIREGRRGAVGRSPGAIASHGGSGS